MVFIAREEPFTCAFCSKDVSPLERGSYRNHCPKCLRSLHVDDKGPGDRASVCKGIMHPKSLDHSSKKGWVIIHVCEKCGKRIPNKVAPDDVLEKNIEQL